MKQLILITLLLLQLVSGVVYANFNPQIQTGNFLLTPGTADFSLSTPFTATQKQYSAPITFIKANTTSYAYAVSFSELRHSRTITTNYSAILGASNLLDSSMTLSVRTNLFYNRIEKLTAVWLIVSNSFTYLNIAHFYY